MTQHRKLTVINDQHDGYGGYDLMLGTFEAEAWVSRDRWCMNLGVARGPTVTVIGAACHSKSPFPCPKLYSQKSMAGWVIPKGDRGEEEVRMVPVSGLR